MSGSASVQAVNAGAQSHLRSADLSSQPEYLLLGELVPLLRFDVTAPSQPRVACWKWLRRKGVRVLSRGLVRRDELVAALEGE